MVKKSSLMSKALVLIMAFAVIFTYSVMPAGSAYAASAKKPAQVKSLKVSDKTSSTVTLKWKKASNAKKYQVYVSTSKSKGYKKAGTTSKKAYTAEGLAAGKTYYFKVRAVSGSKKGKFSAVKSAKTSAASEKAPTLGTLKSRTMTTTIDMTDTKRYPKGHVVEVWVPVPQSDEFQTVTEPVIDAKGSAAHSINYDSTYNNKMVYIKWDEDADPSTRIATITYDAERYEVYRTDLTEDSTAGIPEEVLPYLTEESRFVKYDNEIVKKYAAEAAEGKSGTLEKARAIYEWVIKNLARIDNGEKIGDYTFAVEGCGYGNTVQILTDYEKYGIAGGHCTDINSTFVALCRASGIAAREMFGIRMNDDATGGQHCWAQFYLPGTGWVFADPGDVLKAIKPAVPENKQISIDAWNEAKKNAKLEEYWGRVDANRIQLSTGRDVTLNPAQKADPRNTFGYPYAEVDGAVDPTDSYRNVDAAGEYIDCTAASKFKYSIASTKTSEVPSVAESKVYVSPQWLKSALAGDQTGYENVVVCEVTYNAIGDTTYSKYGHIPGAIQVTNIEVEDADGAEGAYNLLDAETIKENLLKHGITSDTKVVLYGTYKNDLSAARQAYAYLYCGVKDVKILDGHLPAWEAAGYKLETASHSGTEAKDFGVEAPAHPEYWVSTENAKAYLESGNYADTSIPFKLVSIRAKNEWLGEDSGYSYVDYAGEPKGAVWGKGANGAYDVEQFLNEDGTLKSLDGFKEIWKDCGFKTDDTEHLSFYCGTGWRAAVPFLVLYENGYKNISVWDGGWYEWVYAGSHTYTNISYKSDEHKDYPVQIGDPASESVVYTTVGELEAGKAVK